MLARIMFGHMAAAGARLRVLAGRIFARLGFREESFLLLLAVLIGIVTAAAAVAFHELINAVRTYLYVHHGSAQQLYGRGILLLICLPAGGGVAVGLITRYLFRAREGHGIIDVMESVIRWSGVIRPLSALEKIITSGITIGSGGSAGAEGPIVQIGAGIASGIGQLFRIARPHMPVLIGCGSAAGISAIFNAPIGGVFFTLEVILQEFSIRTFTPLVLASVIANVTTKAIFESFSPEGYQAIFAMPAWEISTQADLSWSHLGNFILLGLLCAAVGVGLTRSMHWSEEQFRKLPVPRWLRPGVGGAMLGVMGVLYVVIFGWWLLDRRKPIAFEDYPLPAFFSDGYGVIRQLVKTGETSPEHAAAPPLPAASLAPSGSAPAALPRFYAEHNPRVLLLLLGALIVMKIAGTCMTLSSGGAGGIIAPSLFLGATAGAFLGMVLRVAGADVQPSLYALVGMGAVLAVVVHAPLTSILIVQELTHDYKLILPAMLACVVATGMAKLMFRDSIYTLSLRARGIRIGTAADLSLLRRLRVEQVDLDPAVVVDTHDSFQSLLSLADQTGAGNFVVVDDRGGYAGMVTANDIRTALMQHDAVPLLAVSDVLRADVPVVASSDDLASVLDAFAKHDVDCLPVSVSKESGRVIGLIGRAGLMRRYQRGLAEGA